MSESVDNVAGGDIRRHATTDPLIERAPTADSTCQVVAATANLRGP
jgi:hypothetical protein